MTPSRHHTRNIFGAGLATLISSENVYIFMKSIIREVETLAPADFVATHLNKKSFQQYQKHDIIDAAEYKALEDRSECLKEIKELFNYLDHTATICIHSIVISSAEIKMTREMLGQKEDSISYLHFDSAVNEVNL